MGRGLTLVRNIALLMLILTIHEMGHAVCAFAFGVQIKTFSLGFGPILASWTLPGGTLFSLRGIPLGGSVEIPGLIGAGHTPLATALLIALAGPFANFCTALMVRFTENSTERIDARIWSALRRTAMPIFLIFRDLFVRPRLLVETTTSVIGILKPSTGTWTNGKRFTAWEWLGMISLMFAAMNLLPIPPLDGGMLVVMIVWRHVGETAAHVMSFAGLLFFAFLVIVGFYNDLFTRKHP